MIARSENSFFGVDFAILTVFALLPAGISLRLFLKDRGLLSPTDFFLGNGHDNSLLVGISLLTSHVSPLLLLVHSGELFVDGFMPGIRGFGIFFGFQATAVFVVKVLKPLGFGSPNEYLRHRFCSTAFGLLGTTISVLSTCALSGAGMALAAEAVALTTGGRIPPAAVLFASGGLAIFCAALGGLRGIMLAAVPQAVLILVVMAIVTGFAFVRAGGFAASMTTIARFDRFHAAQLSPDPRLDRSLFGLLLFGLLTWAARAVLPTSVQRVAAVRTPCGATRAFLLASLLCVVLFWLSSLSGLATFAFYASLGCDPVRARFVRCQDLIAPYFVLDQMARPGVLGLYAAAVLTAGLANLSSTLSGTASVLWHDIFNPFCCINSSERIVNVVPKVLVAVSGGISLASGYVVISLPWRLLKDVASLSNCLLAPYLALFCLGIVFPQANSFGAAAGAITGLGCSLSFNLLNTLSPVPSRILPTNTSLCSQPLNIMDGRSGNRTEVPFYQFSEPWTFTFGVLTTIIVGLLVSACAVSKPDVEQRYLWRPFCSSCTGSCCCSQKKNKRKKSRATPVLTTGSEDQLTEL